MSKPRVAYPLVLTTSCNCSLNHLTKLRWVMMGQCSCYIAIQMEQNSATTWGSAGFQQAIAFPIEFWPIESVTAMVCLQHGSQHGVTRQCDGPNLWFASLLYSKQKSPWPKATGLESGVSIPFFNILSRSFLVQSGCEIFRGEDSDTEPFCSVPRLHLRKKIERCVLLSTVPACILLFLV